MEFQQDNIPSFGFSLALPQDMMTIDRAVFDPVRPSAAVSDEESNTVAVGKKPIKKRRPAAKAASPKRKTKAPAKHTTKRKAKTRRVIPEDKTFIEEDEPRDADVVSGRGGKSNNHVGNKKCWLFMLELRPTYKAAADDKTKNEVARQVLDYVHQRDGRYVQKDKDTGRWFILPDKSAMEKAKQTLRDSHVPDWVHNDTTTTPKKKNRKTKKTPGAVVAEVGPAPVKVLEGPKPQASLSGFSLAPLPDASFGSLGGLEAAATRTSLQDFSFGTLGGLSATARASFLLSSSMDGLMVSGALSLASNLSPNSLIAINSDNQEQSDAATLLAKSSGSDWEDQFFQQIRINPTSNEVVGV